MTSTASERGRDDGQDWLVLRDLLSGGTGRIGGEIARTLDWHEAVHAAKLEKFGEQPFTERVKLAATLVREETKELLDELEVIEECDGGSRLPDEWRIQMLARAAQEAADVLFVTLQVMHTLGIPFEKVYAEVLRSNWSKLSGGQAQFREDGKLVKGPSYKAPDIVSIIAPNAS